MAITYKKHPTISYVTKKVGISRQAIHKFIKNLESNGLVEISKVQDNNKDKCLRLTQLGETYFEENENIKATLEKKITETIGVEQVTLLKDLLKLDWGL